MSEPRLRVPRQPVPERHAHVRRRARCARCAAAGVRVETASVRQVPATEALSRARPRGAASGRGRSCPPSPARLVAEPRSRRSRERRAPISRRSCAALRLAHAGGRARLWQLFYFGEAMLLWRWMRGQRGPPRPRPPRERLGRRRDARLPLRQPRGRRAAVDVEHHHPRPDRAARRGRPQARARRSPTRPRSSASATSRAARWPRSPTPRRSRRCTPCAAASTSRRSPPRRPAATRRRPRSSASPRCRAARATSCCSRRCQSCWSACPSARLTLAGDGPERAVPRAPRRGARGRRRRAVPRRASSTTGWRALYDEADVFCLPSFAEGVPIVLMEAMAMEIPVVATEIMGVPELVEDEVERAARAARAAGPARRRARRGCSRTRSCGSGWEQAGAPARRRRLRRKRVGGGSSGDVARAAATLSAYGRLGVACLVASCASAGTRRCSHGNSRSCSEM